MLKKPTGRHKRETTVVFNPEDATSQGNTVGLIRKKRVAAYARVSTELDEQQNSYEAQIEFYTNYIQGKAEWEFVGIYADEGITGTSMKRRDSFNRMIDDAMHGEIDLILTKSISRFSRNTVDALTITRQLRNAGVEVFFEKENISSMDSHAEMIFTVMCSVAQEESRSISENVRWGKQRSMEQSKIALPYSSFLGYEKGEDGLPKIVEEEAEVVRLIYRWYLEGKTFSDIAKSLTKQGYKTPTQRNSRWSVTTVRSILTNEKYKGDARLQKTYIADFLSKEVRVNNGERKQWYIRDSHDAIISPETFELVQQEIKRRAGQRGKYFDSPFTRKVVCGDCGAYYGHRVWHSNTRYRRNIWLCNEKYANGAACRSPRVTDDELKQAFLIAVNRLIYDKGAYCDDYAEKFIPLIIDVQPLLKKQDALNAELLELNVKIEGIIRDNATRPQDQIEYTRQFSELTSLLAQKEAESAALHEKISDLQTQKENIHIFLQTLKQADGLVTSFHAPTWHALIDYAEIMADQRIVLHWRNGNSTSVAMEEVRDRLKNL